MSGALRRLVRAWLTLAALLALQLIVTLALPGRLSPGLVLLLGLGMVTTVGFGFMRLRGGPGLAHAFVVAALFWLAVLLGLGAMDPLTRTDYPVPVTRPI